MWLPLARIQHDQPRLAPWFIILGRKNMSSDASTGWQKADGGMDAANDSDGWEVKHRSGKGGYR